MERIVKYEDPVKTSAWFAVWREIDAGRLKRAKEQSCADCGVFPAQYLHHLNGYEPPHDLEVVPLCSACHGRAHKDKNRRLNE